LIAVFVFTNHSIGGDVGQEHEMALNLRWRSVCLLGITRAVCDKAVHEIPTTKGPRQYMIKADRVRMMQR